MSRNPKKENEIIEVLSRSMLFQGIDKDVIRRLVMENAGRLKKYQKKECLIRTGDPVNAVGVVIKGTILVSQFIGDDRESTVHVLKERKSMGIEYIQKKEQRSLFDYIAQTDVELYSISHTTLFDVKRFGAETVNRLFANVLLLVQHENLRQHQKLYILSMGTLRNKLLTFLAIENKKTNSLEFDISFNRETLAAYLCVNRSALSRELGALEKDGILKTRGKHFIILDKEKLPGNDRF